eukprot:1190829-Pyramimonas_sp.AAC.1
MGKEGRERKGAEIILGRLAWMLAGLRVMRGGDFQRLHRAVRALPIFIGLRRAADPLGRQRSSPAWPVRTA